MALKDWEKARKSAASAAAVGALRGGAGMMKKKKHKPMVQMMKQMGIGSPTGY